MIYNGDETKGVHVVNGGHYGRTTGNFTDATNLPRLQGRVSWLQPALIGIGLMTNDFTDGVPIATYKANIQALIAGMDAACTIRPSYVLIGAYKPKCRRRPTLVGLHRSPVRDRRRGQQRAGVRRDAAAAQRAGRHARPLRRPQAPVDQGARPDRGPARRSLRVLTARYPKRSAYHS